MIRTRRKYTVKNFLRNPKDFAAKVKVPLGFITLIISKPLYFNVLYCFYITPKRIRKIRKMSVDSVRTKVLNAALDLFSQKGFEASSMDEIAAAAGMKGPNLYKYFKGKEEIFMEIHKIADARIQEHSDKSPVITCGADLKAFSKSRIEFTMRDPDLIKLRKLLTIEQFRNDFMRKETSLKQFDHLREQFTNIFRGLMERGLIEKTDPEILALEYFTPVSLLIQLNDREPDRGEEVDRLIDTFLDTFIARIFPNEK